MNTNTPARFTLFLLLALMGAVLIGGIGGMYYLLFYIFAPSEITIAAFIILVGLLVLGLAWVLKKDSPASKDT
ncbi:MAG: hypothetical protein K8L91_28080 [Anaerolineae bacterium]|nr:hypothetical protein [Anaerolineae bacterium]